MNKMSDLKITTSRIWMDIIKKKMKRKKNKSKERKENQPL